MIFSIIKIIIIFSIINLIEFTFLRLFKVYGNIIASLMLNNFLGILLLIILWYLKVLIYIISIKNIIIVSSTGLVGIFLILAHIL